MRYKIGDRVKIKSLDWYNKNKGNVNKTNSVWCKDGDAWFFYHMSQYCGKIMTIKDIWENFYTLEGSSNRWTDEMIECKVEEKTKPKDMGEISDGYHTFNELYEYRLLYNASLFNEFAKQGLYDVHKSRKHSDGEYPFDDPNWFIVMAELPTGQISNHYEMKDWNLFNIPEKEKANVWDGHSPKDVAKRLRKYLSGQRHTKITEEQYLEWMNEFFQSNGAKEYASWKKYLKKAAAKNNLSSIWESVLHGRLGMSVRNYMREQHPEIDDDMQSYAAFEDYSWKLIQKLVKTW